MAVEVFVFMVVIWIVVVDRVVSWIPVVVVVALVVSGVPVIITLTIVLIQIYNEDIYQLYILWIPFSSTHLGILLSYKLYFENWIHYMVNLLRMA